MKIIFVTIMVAWTPSGITPDSVGYQSFWNEKQCTIEAKAFSDKHSIQKEPCLGFPIKVYERMTKWKITYFPSGKEWAIVGGYIGRKIRGKWHYDYLEDNRNKK